MKLGVSSRGRGVPRYGLAAEEAPDTASFVGMRTPPAVTGALGATEAADTASLAGGASAPGISGSLSATEAADTASLAGTVAPPSVTGALGATEAADTAAFAGARTPPAVTGALGATEAADAAAFAGSTSAAPATPVLSLRPEEEWVAADRPRFRVVQSDAGNDDVFTFELTLSTDTGFSSPIVGSGETIDNGGAPDTTNDFDLDALDPGSYLGRIKTTRSSVDSAWSNSEPVTIAAPFVASLDFSDARNSQYLPLFEDI
jgi:hypothetical protein